VNREPTIGRSKAVGAAIHACPERAGGAEHGGGGCR
jgi:hypothetical protein